MNTSFDTQTNDFYSQILKKRFFLTVYRKMLPSRHNTFTNNMQSLDMFSSVFYSLFLSKFLFIVHFSGGGVNAFNYPTINYMLLSQPFSISLTSQKEYIYRQKITLCLDGRRGLEVACLALTSAVWVRTQALALIFIILNNLT